MMMFMGAFLEKWRSLKSMKSVSSSLRVILAILFFAYFYGQFIRAPDNFLLVSYWSVIFIFAIVLLPIFLIFRSTPKAKLVSPILALLTSILATTLVAPIGNKLSKNAVSEVLMLKGYASTERITNLWQDNRYQFEESVKKIDFKNQNECKANTVKLQETWFLQNLELVSRCSKNVVAFKILGRCCFGGGSLYTIVYNHKQEMRSYCGEGAYCTELAPNWYLEYFSA
jgi:hypothetical protein